VEEPEPVAAEPPGTEPVAAEETRAAELEPESPPPDRDR
jgi:hypothetical protein